MDESTKSSHNLFNILFDGKASVRTIVDGWIDSYKGNSDQSLLSLMQLFIDASGCKGRITSICDDFTENIRKLTEDFNEVSSDYPLIQSGHKWKMFKTNLTDFIAHLIQGCQNNILYDDFMMPKLISLLTGLTDSQVRAFRHTATFSVLKLMTSLVDAYISMESKQVTSKRQYDNERSKPSSQRMLQIIEHLVAVNKEMKENVTEIREILTYLFNGVFVLRFRDIVPKIRALCILELGTWMRKLPDVFLDDSHLKYVGWSLSDKISEVRLVSLSVLRPLFESNIHIAKMEFFVFKFKDRIVSMALDIDSSVAIEAVNLISAIIEHYNSIFTTRDTESIYQLVFIDNRGLAEAAGAFLSNKLIAVTADLPIRASGKKVTANTFVMKELIDFFIESELHDHAAYLVDSLLNYCDALWDWDCMTNLLEESSTDESLTSKQEGVLIDIMVCSVKQTSTGKPPVGRAPEKNVKTLKKLKKLRETRQKITHHFSSVLPRLINKFSSDSRNLINLLQIPLCYELGIFLNLGHSDEVSKLLNIIKELFENNHDSDVLQSCVEVLSHLSSEVCFLSNAFESCKNAIIQNIIHSYCSAMIDWSHISELEENALTDLKFLLISSIKKVSLLYSVFDLKQWDLWEIIFKCLREKASEGILNFPDEYIIHSLSCCYFNVLWDLHDYEKHCEEGKPPIIPVSDLKLRFQSFMEFAEFIIRNGSYPCAEEAYRVFCDLLLILSNKLAVNGTNLQENFYSVSSRKVQDLLYPFLKSVLFQKENPSTDIAKLHERRISVASYCKLFTYKVIPVYFLSSLLLHYLETYTDFGDVMDITIMRACELDIVDCARAMINALSLLYEEIRPCLSDEAIEDFVNLRKLSKKFASFLGVEKKSDIFLKVLHTEGILFAIRDLDIQNLDASNIQFFELLLEFSAKLSKINKVFLLSFLKEKMPLKSIILSNKNWEPFVYYIKSLE